jgi:hypothetical protein
MSFNKRFLPKKKKLVECLEVCGSDLFYKLWIKNIDSFIGSEKAIKFINKFLKKRNVEIEEFTRID